MISFDSRDIRIAELEAALKAALEENAQLKALIALLEERLNLNSSNSSKPPSSDTPSHQANKKGKKKRRGHRPCGRKRGAQEGHEKQQRELETEVNDVIPCSPPSHCTCGGAITVNPEQTPYREQQYEIPRMKPLVTEYQRFTGTCQACGKIHIGELPAHITPGLLKPRAMAIISLLSGTYHVSKRNIQHLMEQLFGLKLCVGMISKTESRVSDALKKPVEEAQGYVTEQSVVHADETSHKQAGKLGWMWVAATHLVAVFIIRFSRGASVAKELLTTEFKGILVSDRWSAYNFLPSARRQLCWAHLIRDFTKISERPDDAGKIGHWLLDYAQQMFHLWYSFQKHIITRGEFQLLVRPVCRHILFWLQQGQTCACKKTLHTCTNMLKFQGALFTFVYHEGVDPTNNFAERSLRSYVIWRKISFGTQGETGNHFVERMMTTTLSCNLQQRNVFDFLIDAVTSHYANNKTPSLLPMAA